MWGGIFLGTEGTNICISHVIHEDDHDVGRVDSGEGFAQPKKTKAEQRSPKGLHGSEGFQLATRAGGGFHDIWEICKDPQARQADKQDPASLPAVDAPCRASFRNDHFLEQWQAGAQAGPYPKCHTLTCRIFQSFNLIQIMMVQLFPQRLERLRNFGVVHHPAKLRITWAINDNIDLKAVSMKPSAFMIFR